MSEPGVLAHSREKVSPRACRLTGPYSKGFRVEGVGSSVFISLPLAFVM